MELLLFDGTDTLNLADGVKFAVAYDQWSPNVARLRTDVLGGRGPYEAVRESIPLHARGATGTEALANIQTLARMIDQAARWWRGDDVSAVQLWHKPSNSNLGGYLKNAIAPTGRSGLVGLSPRINEAGNHEIPGLSLDVSRVEGQWLFDAYDVENHCLNSSFESFDGTDFQNWTKIGSHTLAQSNALSHGVYSARISPTSGTHGIYQDIVLDNGLECVVSVRVKRVSGGGQFFLSLYNYGGFSSGAIQSFDGDAETVVIETKTALAGGLRVSLTVESGTVYDVDAVMVEVGATPTTYHPNSDDVFVATAQETGNPHELIADWSISGIESRFAPVDLEIDFLQTVTGTNNFLGDGFLVFKTGANVGNVQVFEAEDMLEFSAPGIYDTHADAEARGGEVRQLIASSVASYSLRLQLFSHLHGGMKGSRYGVWVHCRSYADIAYKMRAQLLQSGTGNQIDKTVVFQPANTDPHYVFLGFIVLDVDIPNWLELIIEVDETTTSALEIDFVVFAPMDEGDSVLHLYSKVFSSGPFNTYTLNAKGRALSHPVPLVNASDVTSYPLGYSGNAYFVCDGYSLSVTPLLTSSKWLYADVNGDVVDFELTARRKLAYLTPQ